MFIQNWFCNCEDLLRKWSIRIGNFPSLQCRGVAFSLPSKPSGLAVLQTFDILKNPIQLSFIHLNEMSGPLLSKVVNKPWRSPPYWKMKLETHQDSFPHLPAGESILQEYFPRVSTDCDKWYFVTEAWKWWFGRPRPVGEPTIPRLSTFLPCM